MKFIGYIIILICFISCANDDFEVGETIESTQGESLDSPLEEIQEPPTNENDSISTCAQSLYFNQFQVIQPRINCQKAKQSQIQEVNLGNSKKEKFLSLCYQATNQSCWCDQVIRPNPKSISMFHCTYGQNQVHQLIHPDEDTWKYAIEAVKIVKEFEAANLLTEVIYNWWRPEPYNDNVGGSPTRHPHGTSIDVRFKSKEIQEQAFAKLCQMRKMGRIRAIGYYASTAIHLGIGDPRANTWGKNCP